MFVIQPLGLLSAGRWIKTQTLALWGPKTGGMGTQPIWGLARGPRASTALVRLP